MELLFDAIIAVLVALSALINVVTNKQLSLPKERTHEAVGSSSNGLQDRPSINVAELVVGLLEEQNRLQEKVDELIARRPG